MNQYIITEEQIKGILDYLAEENNDELRFAAYDIIDVVKSNQYNPQAEREILDVLVKWLKSEQTFYDEELSRISKFAPHLKDKPLCLATDSSMCGLVLDKIKELRQEGKDSE